MIQVGLLTIEQKNELIGLQYQPDSFYNPIQDKNNNWVISMQEIEKSPLQWVKELPIITYQPKPSSPIA